ncbi:MAG: hypothetical protein LBE36_01505 [Flavobacteriaceae bacterium]|jgi:hypothetical protein|nr:hypothetical protein [Flavobacteriaceae bacterium]
MKKSLAVVLIFVGINLSFAQERDTAEFVIDSHVYKYVNKHKEPISTTVCSFSNFSPMTKKGKMFVFWGWNRAVYSNSDIRFKGADYDFQLYDVSAHDRPTKFGTDYINPKWLSAVQYNVRIGYFIKDNLAIVLGIDHMKYIMTQNQTVGFSGHISDPVYADMVENGKVDLSDAKFLAFEHTDGLNYENIGLEKYKTLIHKKNFGMNWSYGAGIGVLFPKSNVTLFGNERSDRFHIAGFGTDFRASLNLVFWNRALFRIEGKYGYINMPDIKTTLNNHPDKAMQDFTFYQILAGIGYTFDTRK